MTNDRKGERVPVAIQLASIIQHHPRGQRHGRCVVTGRTGGPRVSESCCLQMGMDVSHGVGRGSTGVLGSKLQGPGVRPESLARGRERLRFQVSGGTRLLKGPAGLSLGELTRGHGVHQEGRREQRRGQRWTQGGPPIGGVGGPACPLRSKGRGQMLKARNRSSAKRDCALL